MTILYEKGDFFVIKAKKSYEVYQSGVTHAVRRDIIGFGPNHGLERAIKTCNKRYDDFIQIKV